MVETKTQSDAGSAGLSFLPLFWSSPRATSPGKEGGLIIMNSFATNERTAITTFILVPNDSTTHDVIYGRVR